MNTQNINNNNNIESNNGMSQVIIDNNPKPKNFSDLTELERAQYMMEVAQECAKEHPELDWTDVLEKAEKRLEKAQEWQEFLDREAEKQNSFTEGMRVKVPAASLERNRDKEAFVITRIRRKAADNGGNASLTVKSELTGVERDINGSDVSEILPALQEASEITEQRERNDACISSAESRRDKANGQIKDDSFFIKGKKYRCIKSVKDDFTKGKVYDQSSDPTAWCGWLTNNGGKSHGWPQPANIAKACEVWDLKPEDADPRNYFEPVEDTKETEDIREAEGIKVGDKVRHNKHEEVATVTAIREAFVNGCDGYRYLYTLDFGQSVKGPFDVELNGGEFLREAFTVVPDYYSEYQRLDNQEARPTEWIEKATSEEREAYYRACVELERMAGDGLPLVIRADSADLSVNPWNALEKRVKTARVFHLGDRVKVKDGSREVTGIVNGIRCNEGSLALGGWCTHYNIQWDKQYQYTTGYGTVTGCGNIDPERIELIERAEFCPEPTSEWLQPGEKVAHYLDYGDGTGDWLTGNVTGYDLDDNGKGVTVIYGEYRTPLKGMVKYQPEMDGEAA